MKITLKHLTKVFENKKAKTKVVAVNDLDVEIPSGKLIGLLGPSGCGKSTTLRMIAGLETPTSGEIIIDGVTVFDSKKGINISPAKRNVGFLFQNYALWPHMTVYKNIAFGLENLKWSKDQIKARVDELVKMLKIEDYLDTNEWQGKAGAYAIQGVASKFVEKIDGDLENVIGMPMYKVIKYLEA